MNRQQQIQTVLNNFDFEQVQRTMRQRPEEWWKGASGEVPTVEELRTFASELLEQAAEPCEYNCRSVSSGGFYALRWPWEGNGGTDCTMELIFSAEDYSA